MQSKISIIMPVYNAESRVGIAIESILNQTYNNFELILVNDGSSDRSGKICKQYANKDKRIKLINQENLGVSAARNRGIEESTGVYINFIDADDTLVPKALETLIETIKDNNYDMIIYGMSFDYYNRGEYSYSLHKVIDKNIIDCSEMIQDVFFDLYDANYLSSSCNKIIKKSIILQNSIRFDTNMAILEDFKFTLDILRATRYILTINKALYNYYNELSKSKLSKRPNIDYMNNFNILEKSLRKTAADIGLSSYNSQGRINCMIFRYYLIYLEFVFSNEKEILYKYKMLKEFIIDDKVIYANNRASCSGLKLKIIHKLVKYNCKIILTLLFYINNLIRKIYKNGGNK